MLRGKERVAADALARGIPVDISERPAARTLEEAAASLGITPAEIVKTLVVKRSDGSFLFALVPGDRHISWAKLRAAVGVNKLQLPDATVAFDATGYERGTITPLGSVTAWPVWADTAIVGKRVSMGAGEHGHSLWVDSDALIRGLDATIADICTDPAAELVTESAPALMIGSTSALVTDPMTRSGSGSGSGPGSGSGSGSAISSARVVTSTPTSNGSH
jgi:Cys-tRNA(Pro)/Cys-tRNA(Cys) deacylase